MLHEPTPLIAIIVAGIVLAFIFGTIAQRFRVSPLVGYLLAGVAVGPFTPGFVADAGLAAELAEIGVILLMFGVGLHFSLDELLAVRRIAIPGAVVQIAAATLMGVGLALALGWSIPAGIVFGLALSVASTVVLLRALEERRLLQTERGHIAVGWLIVEDLVMVFVLVLLPALAEAEAGGATSIRAIASAIGLTIVKAASFVAVMLVVGRRVDSLASALCRPYRIARALPFGGARDRARRRLRRGHAVRRVFRARRVLCRHDHERIPAQPERNARSAAAARRVRGSLLRVGRDALRAGDRAARAAAAARHLAHHPVRQIARGLCHRARVRPLDRNRADHLREPRADRRILLHPREPWRRAASTAGRGARSHPRGRDHFHRAQPRVLRSDRDPASDIRAQSGCSDTGQAIPPSNRWCRRH